VVFATLLAIAAARPDYPAQVVKILRDDRVHPEAGSYSFDVETEDGIVRSESGSPLSIEGNPTGQQNLPSSNCASKFRPLKFVANAERGLHPNPPGLPEAPRFPPRSPSSSMDQIAFAAQEDAAAAKAEVAAPQQTYGYQ
ncbi:UNVERIFIED_CONTAM: hypothetical protein GTU68_008748, partial [Idotea baltica]|nr:hypothetical protein [Idotea baltica]